MLAAVNSTYAIEYKELCDNKGKYESVCSDLSKKYGIILKPKSLFSYHNNSITAHNINEENTTIMNDQIYYNKFNELHDKETNQKIILNSPLVLRIESDKDGFYYINERYNLYIYGETQEVAENNILDELRSQYIIYALESDDNLDDKAQKLKYDLRALLGENYAKKS